MKMPKVFRPFLCSRAGRSDETEICSSCRERPSRSAGAMRQPSPNVSHPERGLGIVTLLIFGGLILGVSLSAMRIIPIYYRYFEIEAQMRAMADKADELSLDEIRYRVSWLMRTNGIPTQEKDLRVFREGQNVILSLKYHEPWEVTLFDKVYLLHDFQFNPVVKRYVVK